MSLSPKSSFLKLLTFGFIVFVIHGCGGDNGFFNGPNYENVPDPFIKNVTDVTPDSTTEGGLNIYFVKQGSGAFEVISRDQVLVSYTGRTEDGEIFDSTYRNGAATRILSNLTPVPIPGQRGQISPLIAGFRRGLIGMKEGEKRVLVIPPSLGYGNSEGHELQNDTLIFDVKLVSIRD